MIERRYSPPVTAEDFMSSSAFAVSPILTSAVFDEIFTQPVEELAVRHHRRSYISSPMPPPGLRWRRRLERAQDDHIGPVNDSFMYGQNCLNDEAVNTNVLCEDSEHVLDFDVVFDDGGQYGAMYSVENLLLNDGSVYCSGRKGVVNILAQYCGYIESGILADTNCSISKLVIKAPRHGFTAPCKDGMIFISHKEIDITKTMEFDYFTKEMYDDYVENKLRTKGILDDTDPIAWFTLGLDRLSTMDIADRSGKYVLVKLLRSDYESDNIDVQYIGFIGHAGARSFAYGKLI